MALSELAAIEAAYHALLSLDDAGRGRALRWLSDALDAPAPLPGIVAAEESATPAAPAPAVARATTRKSRGRAASLTPLRKASKNGDGPSRRGRRRSAAQAGERAYRRMPDPEEVLAAYHKVGTVSGLADHFGVPTHTVQGWARRLREKGHQIGRNA